MITRWVGVGVGVGCVLRTQRLRGGRGVGGHDTTVICDRHTIENEFKTHKEEEAASARGEEKEWEQESNGPNTDQ